MSNNPQSIEYYKERFDLLFWPSGLITLYYAIFLVAAYYYNVLIDTNRSWIVPAFLHLILLVFNLYLGYMTISKSANPTLGLIVLIISTAAFISLIAIPIYLWGGSNKSCFSPILATICSLTVLVTKAKWTRRLFAGFCILLFIFLSWRYHDITVNKEVVVPSLNLKGTEVYAILQTLSAIFSIVVSIFLSRQTSIFKDDAEPPATTIKAKE